MSTTLMVDFIISLDGCAGAEGWPSYWGLEGPEYLAWLEDDTLEGDPVQLMGANTYRLFAGYMAQATDPASQALNAARKIVFSSTLTEPLSWENTELIAGDPVEAVRELKQRESREVRTVGSLTLVRSLVAAGLVDRFRVVVFPVITGATGTQRIFDGYPDLSLDLVESRTFDGNIQLLEYRPTVLDGPPQAAG